MIKDTIQAAVEEIDDTAVFCYDEKSAMNVRADGHVGTIAYLQEVTNATVIKRNYREVVEWQVVLEFMRFTEFHDSGEERDEIRAALMKEEVLPFIAEIRKRAPEVGNVALEFPIYEFDANEVGVVLKFKMDEAVC